jgi:hypothetical protein
VPIKKKKIIAQSHELYTSRRFTNSTIHAATRAHRRQRPQDSNAAAPAVHDDIGGGGGLPRWHSNDRAEHAFVTVHVGLMALFMSPGRRMAEVFTKFHRPWSGAREGLFAKFPLTANLVMDSCHLLCAFVHEDPVLHQIRSLPGNIQALGLLLKKINHKVNNCN